MPAHPMPFRNNQMRLARPGYVPGFFNCLGFGAQAVDAMQGAVRFKNGIGGKSGHGITFFSAGRVFQSQERTAHPTVVFLIQLPASVSGLLVFAYEIPHRLRQWLPLQKNSVRHIFIKAHFAHFNFGEFEIRGISRVTDIAREIADKVFSILTGQDFIRNGPGRRRSAG